MNQKVADIRAEQWRSTVCECINRAPGVSKRQWCMDNGIKYRSFMYWQRRFQLEALGQMEKHELSFPAKHGPADVPAFADMTTQLEALQAEQESVPPEPETAVLAPELMIQAGSYRIYVNSSIHEDTLEKVMRVIRHA